MANGSEDGTRRGATILLSKGLTPGKLRGLQRISNPNGTLTMLALDQNSSVIAMAAESLLARGEARPPNYEEIVEIKLDLMRHLATAASGVLIDAYYGAWSAIASGSIPPQTGLLVRFERSGGPKNRAGAPLAFVEPGWSVEKIKLMGADAVKLLAPFEPTEVGSAEHQFQLVDHVWSECRRHDILLVLETVSFPFGGEARGDASYLERKPRTVIEAARQLSRFCDVYKAEFPGTLGRDDPSRIKDALHALDAVCERPWVLLSAAVDYPDYVTQVEMAMEVGATGILGGRAFWKEYFREPDAASRSHFAATTARKRVEQVDALVRSSAVPWYQRYGLTKEELAGIRAAEGWHARYASSALRTTVDPRGHSVSDLSNEVY